MNANYTFYAARNRNGGTELEFLGGNSLCPAPSPVPPYYQAEPRKRISAFDEKPTSPGSFSFPFEKFGAKPRGETRLFSGPRYVGARIARKLSRSGTRLD